MKNDKINSQKLFARISILLFGLFPLLISAQDDQMQVMTETPIDLSGYELKNIYDNDFSEHQKIEYEENLLQRGPDGEYRRVRRPAMDAEWIAEGWGEAKVRDGKLYVTSGQFDQKNQLTPPDQYTQGKTRGKSHMVIWNNQRFPDDFLLEFKVNHYSSDDGLTLVFFSASGMNGESIFDLSLPPRWANYPNYHHGALKNYTDSYWSRNNGQENASNRLRKNPGKKLVVQGPSNTIEGFDNEYQIRILKAANLIEVEVNGKRVLSWEDPDPPLGAGYIGLRNMSGIDQVSYDDFKVYEITDINLDKNEYRLLAGNYRGKAMDFAKEMIVYGTDRYGREHSPLFAGMLIRSEIPTLPPDLIISGQGEQPKPGIALNIPNVFRGSNLAHKVTYRGSDANNDVGLLKLLYSISEETGDIHYARAADSCLSWLINHTPMDNGIIPWGEHSGWDFRNERFDYGYVWDKKHELDEDWPFWEKLNDLQIIRDGELSPLEKYAGGLWKGTIGYNDDNEMIYCRHTSLVEQERPEYGDYLRFGMFPRHGGYSIKIWSSAISFSNNDSFIESMTDRLTLYINMIEKQINKHGFPIYVFTPGDISYNPSQMGGMAAHLFESSEILENINKELSVRMQQLAGVISGIYMDKQGEMKSITKLELYRWNNKIGNEDLSKFFLQQASTVADSLVEDPQIKDREIGRKGKGYSLPGRIPGQYAEAIEFLVSYSDVIPDRKKKKYLDAAEKIAAEAVELFTDTKSALPKNLDRPLTLLDGTAFPSMYQSYLGSDDLMYSFWLLAEQLENIK